MGLEREGVGTFAAGVRDGDQRCGEWRGVGLSRIIHCSVLWSWASVRMGSEYLILSIWRGVGRGRIGQGLRGVEFVGVFGWQHGDGGFWKKSV